MNECYRLPLAGGGARAPGGAPGRFFVFAHYAQPSTTTIMIIGTIDEDDK
jgi:hypothetical protein